VVQSTPQKATSASISWTSSVQGDGWPKQGAMLPVFKLGGHNWIMGRLYRHNKCPGAANANGTTTFNTFAEEFLKQLPPGIQGKFPGKRSRYQVVDKSLLYFLERFMLTGTAANFGRMLKEVELENALDHQFQYVDHVMMYNQIVKAGGGGFIMPVVPEPSRATLHDSAKYATGQYYLQMYKVRYRILIPRALLTMSRRTRANPAHKDSNLNSAADTFCGTPLSTPRPRALPSPPPSLRRMSPRRRRTSSGTLS